MTDILIRICVGACGVAAVAGSIRLMPNNTTWMGMLWVSAGLITILRALGVL